MRKPKRKRRMTAMAPVAEYWGVAIVEIAGNNRAVWNGVEYGTDGRSWLISRPGMESQFNQLFPPPKWVSELARSTLPGHVVLLGLPDERNAKEILDEVVRIGENPASFFLSFRDVMAILDGPSGLCPPTKWDEEQGVFVR
ncbi:MAG: hypothetical protein ACYC0X_12230 [Pirellulaceae bacterium]